LGLMLSTVSGGAAGFSAVDEEPGTAPVPLPSGPVEPPPFAIPSLLPPPSLEQAPDTQATLSKTNARFIAKPSRRVAGHGGDRRSARPRAARPSPRARGSATWVLHRSRSRPCHARRRS